MPHRKEGTIRDRGYLPHWETERACYFVTFRLGDSIPKTLLESIQDEWKRVQEDAVRRNRELTPSEKERLARLRTKKIESYLDTGAGACYLKDPKIARIVADALRHFDGERYRLHAWCVMPNHVHVVFQPLHGWKLSKILHSWKSYSAKKANAVLGRSGVFWDREYYDHLIRNEEEYGRILQYVLDNPEKAGLKDWPWLWIMVSELQQ